jgi:hypothetical protein
VVCVGLSLGTSGHELSGVLVHRSELRRLDRRAVAGRENDLLCRQLVVNLSVNK